MVVWSANLIIFYLNVDSFDDIKTSSSGQLKAIVSWY